MEKDDVSRAENSEPLELTEDERRYLQKVAKRYQKIYLGYITVGLILSMSISELVLGIVSGEKNSFKEAMFYFVLAAIMLFSIRVNEKHVRIMLKLEKMCKQIGTK